MKLLISILSALLLGGWAMAQPSSCWDGEVSSKPGRPAMTNGADPTLCGVVELEYGLERRWAPGSSGTAVAGGLRFGITPNLDFHWSAGDFLHISDPDGGRSGYGDNWLGFAYRYLRQTKERPSLGIMYMAKIPTGDADEKFGSGEVDHSLLFLLSKDVRRLHLDFNAGPQWMGVAHSGSDRNVTSSMAASYPATRRITLVLESYGATAANSESPAYSSWMVGSSLQVHPRLYLDAGYENGITAGGPGTRVFAGITVAAANAYRWLRPQRM